jgi:Protein of unknown function (DUF1524)/Protein of unknown function DUF262
MPAIEKIEVHHSEEYFLGTLVLTQGESGRQMVIDGQQRLATTCILIGAIRDYFELQGDTERANEIKKKYLSKRTIRILTETPHLVLDEVDNEFFISNVLTSINDPRRKAEHKVQSHERITGAIAQAKQLINNIRAISHSLDDILLNWLDYLHDNTKAIIVEVTNAANAFTIFEVLNDRGLDLSVSALLKNYIFSKSQDRISEAKEAWIGLLSHLEYVGGDKQVKDFIRHFWSSVHGLTREKDLYDSIKSKIKIQEQAVRFAISLKDKALTYSAFSSPSHEIWRPLGAGAIVALEIMELLGYRQNRPLLIALSSFFTEVELRRAFPGLAALAVRIIICGKGGTGPIEKKYCDIAMAVSNSEIKTAQELYTALKTIVPSDQEFQSAFTTLTASNNNIARYYLREINTKLTSPGNKYGAELIVNPSEEQVTLEHIMPQTLSKDWKVKEEVQKVYCKRIGNLTLLDRKLNSSAGNIPFEQKKALFSKSDILITREVTQAVKWEPEEIEQRQVAFAKIAIKIWDPKPA